MEQSDASKREKMISLAVLIAIVLIVAGVMIFMRRTTDKTTGDSGNNPTSQQTSQSTTSSTTASTATFKDGDYSATGNYSTPGGRESVDVKLTLKGNTVTAVNVQGNNSGGEAAEYQDAFESGYKQYVVGKPLSEIRLSRVSGSSLTSQGFNDALTQIADQARS